MAGRLSEAEITPQIATLAGWIRQGDALRKTFQHASFPAAIAFVVRVGFLAEAANHHPDIDIRWQHVTLVLSTHDVGGLSQKDVDLAKQIDAIAG